MKLFSNRFFKILKGANLTLRRRFVLYAVSAIITTVTLLLLLLSVLGVLDPADSRIKTYLDDQLYNHAKQINHDTDKLAAHSISFADQMEKLIDEHLSSSEISFDELKNNVDELTAIQKKSWSTVYTSIRTTPCSGAFYILDTTVNDTLKKPLYNGLYIKFANLYAENTLNTNVSLFRGSSEIARENNINLSSTWQNEMITDVFSDVSAFKEFRYAISPVTKIPDTWERARYVYSPIYDKAGEVIGICGFEISSLYTQLSYAAADNESAQTICALMNETENGYVGQFISNRSGYIPPVCETITAKKHKSFYDYTCGEYEYIGKQTNVCLGSSTITVAVMIPKKQYRSIVLIGRIKNVAVFFIGSLVALLSCLWLSKKYISPFKKSLALYKKDKSGYSPTGISEIDEFFSYLAEEDRKTEKTLEEMENKKAEIESDLKKEINEHTELKRELERLAYSRKTEVDPDDYRQFLEGVKTLTQTEKNVFDLYLEGKKVKEIVDILGIKETTVRFHNRNIYSKLGVKSLKQMLLYASIMNQSNE